MKVEFYGTGNGCFRLECRSEKRLCEGFKHYATLLLRS